MKIKSSTKIRIASVVWISILILLSLVWWAICILEWISKIKQRKLISNLDRNIKVKYFEILFDAYMQIYYDMRTSFKSIKVGRKLWR